MRYLLVDVFAPEPLAGNGLVVFPEPGALEDALMQRIAREMNLSETTFVTAVRPTGYDVRIFTPAEELPFAGHPTLGTAWVLQHLGMIDADEVEQISAAGPTHVTLGQRPSFARDGTVEPDVEAHLVADALGIDVDHIGFDASAIGARAEHLLPAFASVGVRQLMVPIADPGVVGSMRAPTSLGDYDGVYVFAPLGRGAIKARFFAPGIGVAEDPATGSAAAALGVYIGTRAGEVSFQISQGAEIGRPSALYVDAQPGRARVSGDVHLIADATFVA